MSTTTTTVASSHNSAKNELLFRVILVAVFILSSLYLVGYTGSIKASQTADSGSCLVTTVETTSVSCESGAPIGVNVTGDDGKSALSNLKQGSIIERPSDGAIITVRSAKDIGLRRASPGYLCALAGIAAGLVSAFLYCGIISKCVCPWRGFKKLVVGEDERPSNSKTQVTLWLGILLVAFVGTSYMRWMSGMYWSNAVDIGISSELLTLAGISVATAGAAKVVTASRAKGGAKGKPEDGGSIRDLYRNDKKDFDLADALMSLATIVLAGFFAWSVWGLWQDCHSAHTLICPIQPALHPWYSEGLSGHI